MSKQVVVIAGPAGSGKDSIVRGVLERCNKSQRHNENPALS